METYIVGLEWKWVVTHIYSYNIIYYNTFLDKIEYSKYVSK